MIQWFVYILRCSDNSLYTGITTNVDRRLLEHNGKVSGSGAKCTRSRRPVNLVYIENYADRSTASKREYEIKKYTHGQKESLFN